MFSPRLLTASVIVLTAVTAFADTKPTRTRAKSDATHAKADRGAVVVVRVTEGSDDGALRAVEVVDPRNLPANLFDPQRKRTVNPQLAAGAPRLGRQYELIDTWTPDSARSAVHYYIYQMDLSDPMVARNWQELHRVQQLEARRDYWTRRYDQLDQARRARLIRSNQRATMVGLDQLRAGDYRQAILSFTLATELDNGDPACRIHLAQARIAVGHDAEAAAVLRRALQLQPKLVPMQLGLDEYYPESDVFDAQVDALGRRLAERKDVTAEEWFLLGFFEFQRDRLDRAHVAFARAAAGLPKDDLLRQYLTITKPAAR